MYRLEVICLIYIMQKDVGISYCNEANTVCSVVFFIYSYVIFLLSLLFWTDWGAEPKIERSSMDGHNRTVLHSVHIVWPNGLTVDYITKSLYWADAKLRIIESSFYDGSNRRPVLLESVRHSFAITLFENKLFWSEWETRSIFSTNKGVGHRVQQIKHNVTEIETNLFRPMDLRVVHPLRQRSTPNPCAHGNGGCEFLCLLSAFAPEGYSCACPTGIELDSDGKNCKRELFVCVMILYQLH